MVSKWFILIGEQFTFVPPDSKPCHIAYVTFPAIDFNN